MVDHLPVLASDCYRGIDTTERIGGGSNPELWFEDQGL
jgi:hypothetical protein